MSECKICKIHSESNYKEYEFWIIREADKDKNIPGYFYIESKHHVESYSELSRAAWMEFGTLVGDYSKFILDTFKPIKIYTISIAEAVPHLHFHLVPRYIEKTKGLDYLGIALTGRVS